MVTIQEDRDARSALAELVAAGGVVVLSGAGLSTDSGLPDYRGRDGVRRVTPMTIQQFRSSSEYRRRYWARGYLGWTRFAAAAPNPGHHAVAKLERDGLFRAVITQNVDGLHQAAGSLDPVELHGSLAWVVCGECDRRLTRTELQDDMRAANPGFDRFAPTALRPDGDVDLDEVAIAAFQSPRCPSCGSDLLKPDVVFFGDNVPRDRVARCIELVDAATSLFVVGSSLQVQSGLRFVRQASRRGIPIAIATLGQTRGDPMATIRIDAALSPLLTSLAADS